MRWIVISGCLIVGTGCGSELPMPTAEGVAFDSVGVAAEIDSVMNRLVPHQLANEFDEFNAHYSSHPEGTAAGDGNFFGLIPEFLDHMEPVFASVDSIPSFEWTHYQVYPTSSNSAVFAGQYRELVAMGGAAAVPVVGSFTALWEKRDGDWRMKHAHTSHVR